VAFAAWRFLLANVVPPVTLVAATGIVVAGLLGALLWLHHTDAENAGRAYVPARIEDGRIIPGHAASGEAKP
jgi:hypothetical protein